MGTAAEGARADRFSRPDFPAFGFTTPRPLRPDFAAPDPALDVAFAFMPDFDRLLATESSRSEAYPHSSREASLDTLPPVIDDATRGEALGLLCLGFEGESLDETTARLLREGAAGVILFARNFVDRSQVASLCAEIRRAAGARPVLIGVDHEGGRVQRFRGPGFTDLPSARLVGSWGDPASARGLAETAACELRAVGVNLDFAPVLDVDSNPANAVIGDRSYSSDPAVVAAFGAAVTAGLQSSGVAACGKHFPGHGDTHLDSHLELPRLPHDRARLDSVELLPFRSAIDAGVASIMTAHVVFDAIDPTVPATMSRRVIDGLLRRELGFGGVIVSDDLDMKAIAGRFDVGDAAVRSIDAGCDLLLCCRSVEHRDRALDALQRAIREGSLARDRVHEALARVRSLAARFRPP